MSARVLPEGSTFIVTIMRPGAGGIGAFRITAVSDLGVSRIAAAIQEQLPVLFENAALPELLLPGAPLTMLLQVILPDGQLMAHAPSATLLRAAHREEMIAAWSRDIPGFVAFALDLTERTLQARGCPPLPRPVVH